MGSFRILGRSRALAVSRAVATVHAVGLAVVLMAGCAPTPDDETLVRDFAASITASAACSSGGYRACQRERLSRAYPGSLDETVARACIDAAADDPKYRYTVSVVPGSLVAAPEWVGPPAGGSTEWLFEGQRPEGTTYVVSLAVSDNYQGDEHTVTWESHVTVRDGSVYWYPNIC